MSMDKRTVLMLTAKRLFAVNGFYGTPTARIAKEAGVSNGILFHYFPTKEALIKAMYFDLKDRLFVYSTSQVYKGATLKESIYTLWLAAVEWNLENPDDFDFMQQFENSPYYSLELEKSHRYVQMSLELAQKGIDEGIFKQVPASLLFQTMSGLVETAVQYLRLFKETQEDTEFKNRLFEMAWDAISKNKI
jgi:AcrR family transcriptional regulator